MKDHCCVMARAASIGKGKVVLQCLDDREDEQFAHAEAVTIKHTYPLKFLLPKHAGNKLCKWIFPITFGGGLVGGDKIEMTIEVQDNACGLVTSQESTKIYHCEEDLETVQTFTGIIGKHALLCVLPDYLVCYKDARYYQQQVFEMSSKGNLVCLDWLTAGRIAREESWELTKYLNKMEIRIDGELVFRDCVQLEDMPLMSIKESMTKYMAMGTCIILGGKLQTICDSLEEKFARRKTYGESYETEKIISVSKLHYERWNISGLYIRFMAVNTTLAFSAISEIVELLIPILGSDPFQNKY